jgi:hypothetical protein
MSQPLQQAWQQLSQGEYDAAHSIFADHLRRDQNATEPLLGMARLALYRGDLARAESLARQASVRDESGDLQILLGEIRSKQGQRREAEQHLRRAVAAHPKDAYARALLAEQKIRQARWDEGTQDYIEALNDDPDGDGFRHLQSVLVDLVDAFIAGRIPENEAMKFVNRLDYSTPKSGPAMQQFFGRVRRAINGRQPLGRLGHSPESMLPRSIRRRARGRATAASAPQQQRPPTSSPQPPPKQAKPPSRAAPSRPPAGQASRSSAPSRTQQQPKGGSDSATDGIDPNKKNLQDVIKEERSLNANLLSDLDEMGPPEWPSLAGYDSIDDVEPVLLERESLLAAEVGIDTRDFRVTSGPVLSQIFLERCLLSLLSAAQRNQATTLVLRPESISQIELNCRDGLLANLRPLSPLYADRDGFDDYRQLALGMFLGQCLANAYDATWRYDDPAVGSTLKIGPTVLEPFDLAGRWMRASDKDDVVLESIARQAEEASTQSTSLTVTRDYIDPTTELVDAGLATKLAELWTDYRVTLGETSFSSVAATITPVSTEERAIIFEIGTEWVPEYALGPQEAAITSEQRVALAYLRGTGEFVVLASRKGLAQYLEATFDELDNDSGRRAVELLARYHRPRWHVASNDDLADTLSQRSGTSVQAPNIRADSGSTTLVVEGLNAAGPVTWEIVYKPDTLIPWSVHTS